MAKFPKPDFIDNRAENTLARALADVLGVATTVDGGRAGIPDEVRIATAYFSPTGFAHIADNLKSVSSVRLMLGADIAAGAQSERRTLGEDQKKFAQRQLKTGLKNMDDRLRRDRDRLPFIRTSGRALRKLIEALRSGNMEVRRYEDSFMHAKAYIITPAEMQTKDKTKKTSKPEGIIAGSSNLTGAGMTSNLELNIGHYGRPITKKARQWFDDLWEEAKPYDLASVFEEAFQTRTPWEVFIRVLWQLYGKEVEIDVEAKTEDDLLLTNFQEHGVARVRRLIEETGGAIVADEVGLGKTFIAGRILKDYINRRQRALLICPAALRDSTWDKFLVRFQMFAICLSFEELASDKQLRDHRRPNAKQDKLKYEVDEYQLVIVDEAHNYRNPHSPTRAAALRKLLAGRRRDVLFLTATPVNNSLWDFYHLMRFFVRQDARFAAQGIPSIRDRFLHAMSEDPSNLSPDVLYPIIDATTVKRTRQFVKKHYSGETIENPYGGRDVIKFPKPIAKSVHYNLDDTMARLFELLEIALDPDGDDAIKFARYMPDEYLHKGDKDNVNSVTRESSKIEKEYMANERRIESSRARAMVGLLRSAILKRFESSAFAFRRTIERMVKQHDAFLEALDAGRVVTTKFLQELSGDEEATLEDVLAISENHNDAKLYDRQHLRETVQHDRDALHELSTRAREITQKKDPKLEALVDQLVAIAQEAKSETTDDNDESQKRKVLVFSSFEDTVKWIHEFLTEKINIQPDLSGYRGRIESVSGSDRSASSKRLKVVQGFAPESMEAQGGNKEDLYDLLVSTDVLAEGVNLQQCRHIINFDMPWNPMRLVQRHGRIDRIRSKHARVFMRTIFPTNKLDAMLNLEQRIRDKLAMAAASVGVAAPIEGMPDSHRVFAEDRAEIEKLLKNDATIFEQGGTASAAQTGEEYRQSLRKALDGDRERIENMPWKVGSGMKKGARRGVFFCAVVGDRTYLRFVPADETWEVAVAGNTKKGVGLDAGAKTEAVAEKTHDRNNLGDAGVMRGDGASRNQVNEMSIVREIGTCLRLIECDENEEPWYPDDLQERVYDFWEAAKKDILDDWAYCRDPKNLQPHLESINRRVADFIRKHKTPSVDREKRKDALNVVESPWDRRERSLLNDWFKSDEFEGEAKAKFLIERILETGLEPADAPKPLPRITEDDIDLLCWMGIERSDDVAENEK